MKGAPGTFCKINSVPLTSAQAIWAEILAGKRWFEAGCPGYARPLSSLNDLKVMEESDLAEPVTLLSDAELPQGKDLVLNMPLLGPTSNRLWLSDGSLPMHTAVSPKELADQEPFSQYRPRPFVSANVALSDVRRSVLDCLSTEYNRLDCFRHLVTRSDWKRCLLRVNVFDLLSHLLGNEFLGCDDLLFSPEISEFVSFFDECLKQVQAELTDLSICFVSAFSHGECHARLNLNQLLQEGGFCRLDAGGDVSPAQMKRRAAATRLVKSAGSGGSGDKEPLVARSNSFNSSRTLAGSPVQGCIYVNGKDRFVDGIVEQGDRASVVERVHSYLSRELSKAFGSRSLIWTAPDRRHARYPDLMVYVEGVELHNSFGPPLIDYVSKPRSIHAPEGFVWLPLAESARPAVLEPVQVHVELKNIIN